MEFLSESVSRPISSDEEVMLGRRNKKFRGARLKKSGKWVSEMREPNKKSRIWLGTFPTAEMAARAHDVAALALRGQSAYLNFADSAWRLPLPASNDPKDIQRAAAEAAEAFRPAELDENSEDEYTGPAEIAAEGTGGDSEEVYYMEEDFGMPEMMADMANAMMLPPPHLEYTKDDMELGTGPEEATKARRKCR